MRAVVNNSFSAMILLYAEILRKADLGIVTPEQQVWLNTAILSGHTSLRFNNTAQSRFAWAVQEKDDNHFLVWFGSSLNLLHAESGNTLPDINSCASAIFVTPGACIDAVEDFIVHEQLPENYMHAGHLQTLIG